MCIRSIRHRWTTILPSIQYLQSRHISAISEGITKEVQKLILILDRAAQHYRSSKVKKHLEESKGVIRVEYLPKGSPGLSAVEECWRQGKDELLVSRYYSKFRNLKKTIAEYYRTKRFRLDITNYLLRSIT
ncbi:MAG: transposase [Nitrososphaeraceae archaeon]